MNLHKFYYKKYFAGVDFHYLLNNNESSAPSEIIELIKQKNIQLLNSQLSVIENDASPTDNNDNINRIPLQICYPGLVTGVGIDHQTNITGEFKLGMHFDWTHGMPIVYGSSVKGVLRSWFIDIYESSEAKYYDCGIDAGDLMMDIFSGIIDRDIDAEKKKYGPNWEQKTKKEIRNRIYRKNKSIYDRDIFFDAVLTKADSQKRILCSDSITPHPHLLKNPIPISFLKIAPGCTLEFRFNLKDSIVGGKTFSAKQKSDLFREILTTVGVGAKTNVGYGQLK